MLQNTEIAGDRSAVRAAWRAELRATLVLAWPLIVAQLAQMSLLTTDVIMMGWLGPQSLAAGTLAGSVLHPLFLGGLGVITATAPLIAQAIGAMEGKSVRRTVRQGFWASVVVSLVLVPVLWQARSFFLAIGQSAPLVDLTQSYLQFAVWMILPGLLIVPLRSLLSARNHTAVILWITIAGFFVNAAGNYALMFGNFGFPRLELAGAGITTTTVNSVMFLLALAFVVWHRRFRRYYILVRLWKPDWARFREIFRIGIPIGLALMSEVGVFGVASMMMGLLGTNELAAHAVALQCASITFMVPLGLSQATTIRVGLVYGAKNRDGIGRAGWTSMALTLGFMSLTCAAFILFPAVFVTLFLDPGNPANTASLALAATYLAIAGLFQLVDGAQVTAAAALRGLSDTRTPMVVALIGYWGVALSVAYLCGFVLGLRGVGVWLGLASGLAFVAVVLSTRFAMRERLGLTGALSVEPVLAMRASGK